MPSSYTTPYQLEKQFTGENVNTWGERLNTVIENLAQLLGGLNTVALTGDYTLATSNTGTNDTRAAVLKFTGTGPYAVTLPSSESVFVFWNACSASLTFTTGAGTTLSVDATDIVLAFCDGTNVKTLGFNGVTLKDYISSVVVGGGDALPSPIGHSGKWLTNDGATPSWDTIQVAEITDYASDQATKLTTATNLAAAFAVAL